MGAHTYCRLVELLRPREGLGDQQEEQGKDTPPQELSAPHPWLNCGVSAAPGRCLNTARCQPAGQSEARGGATDTRALRWALQTHFEEVYRPLIAS